MKEFAVKALKWPRVLTFLIFFLPLNVNAAPVDSLVQSITPTTIASGKRAEINLTLSEEIDHISLMPGGPYVSDTISFPQDLGSIASDGERIFASGIHNEVFVISGPFGKLSESAVLLSEGKAKNIFPSGPALYFSNKTGLKKVKPNSRKIHKTVNIFDFEKDITSFIIDSKKAYLLLGKREVVVLDTGPPAPKVLGKYALSFDAYSVIVQKGTCYVASKMRGLTLLDIQNPEEISEIGSYKTTGPALDMAISGKFAFIADGWTGMTVLDVSAPEKVTWVSGLNNIGYSEKIEVEGTHTTIKNNLGEITVVDVQKPERPKTLERIAFKEEVQGFTLLNETLFVLQGNEVQKVRLKEARSPEYLNDGVNLGGSRRFFLRDHIAYVADWFSGLHLYDISIPNKPALLSNFHTPGSPKGVLVDGALAFVGDDDHGLQIINISDPLHPSLISNLRMPGLAYTMKRRENLLYIA
ncbi:MAG: LVIVD repeat-containing protein, partial [Nitrospinota bacterium]